MANMPVLNAGELAKTFVEAVDKSLGLDVTDGANTAAGFMLTARRDEIFNMIVSRIQPGQDGKPVARKEVPLETYLFIANIYAKLMGRAGESAAYKQFVPTEAGTEQGQAILKEKAPIFAKLAL
jgi:hypothetical protein